MQQSNEQPKQTPPLDLIGRTFIIWGDDGKLDFQGVVRGQPNPGLYLCQFFSAIDGTPTDLTVISVEKMIRQPYRAPGSFMLFENDEHLRFWVEHRYRVPSSAPKSDQSSHHAPRAKRKQYVPRRDAAVIKAEANEAWGGDTEKVSTSAVDRLDLHGVLITSRYNKAEEFDVMGAMVDAMPDNLRELIESIYCDSKACACYQVQLNQCSPEEALAAVAALEEACLATSGGHNGMYCSMEGGSSVDLDLDPRWPADDLAQASGG